MAEFILFGGTFEGREVAESLEIAGFSAVCCVATEYGEALLSPGEHVRISMGRLDSAGMEKLFAAESPRMVIDATHPYAIEVSKTVKSLCESMSIPYLRVLRESSEDESCIKFENMEALIAWLNDTPGTVFSTLGAKEATALASVRDFEERIYIRILPLEESLSIVRKAGFPPKHIICMQGPFSKELNEAMFRTAGASIMLTKDTGVAGGFPEKLAAAKACGMTVALLPRPNREEGMTLNEIKRRIEEKSL